MAGRSIQIEALVSRNPEMVGDRLVRGLVNGGLVGPGWVIEHRAARGLAFRRPGLLADRGEIALAPLPEGTSVICRIWCPSCGLRAAGVGVVAAVLSGADLLASLGGGGLAAAGAALVGGLAALVTWTLGRRRLRRQVAAFLANTMFLKAS
jgi:hypothetical protein